MKTIKKLGTRFNRLHEKRKELLESGVEYVYNIIVYNCCEDDGIYISFSNDGLEFIPYTKILGYPNSNVMMDIGNIMADEKDIILKMFGRGGVGDDLLEDGDINLSKNIDWIINLKQEVKK